MVTLVKAEEARQRRRGSCSDEVQGEAVAQLSADVPDLLCLTCSSQTRFKVRQLLRRRGDELLRRRVAEETRRRVAEETSC
jgi:hypothetical protein